MNQKERDELRLLAEAATPGPYETISTKSRPQQAANASFIVAANPSTVLSLLDDVGRLTHELQSSHDYLAEDGCGDRTTRDVIRGMRDALLLCRYCGGGDHVYANCPVLAADKGGWR